MKESLIIAFGSPLPLFLHTLAVPSGYRLRTPLLEDRVDRASVLVVVDPVHVLHKTGKEAGSCTFTST